MRYRVCAQISSDYAEFGGWVTTKKITVTTESNDYKGMKLLLFVAGLFLLSTGITILFSYSPIRMYRQFRTTKCFAFSRSSPPGLLYRYMQITQHLRVTESYHQNPIEINYVRFLKVSKD